jgi:ABC-type oligopeptide transport system ATPase subunit
LSASAFRAGPPLGSPTSSLAASASGWREITSALDVSVQASIVELLMTMQKEDGLSMLFITHNLALVRNIADRVMILNQGTLVEAGQTDAVLDQPQDDYTRRLLSDTPRLASIAPLHRAS